GTGDPAGKVDRDDLMPGIEQRLPDREEVADRGLGGRRQFGITAQTLVEGVEAVHLKLTLRLTLPAHIQAHLMDALVVRQRAGKVVRAVGRDCYCGHSRARRY